mgnify:CR=1 FL=1
MVQAAITYSRLLSNVAGIGVNGIYAEFCPGDHTMPLDIWDQVRDYPTVRNWLDSGDLIVYESPAASEQPASGSSEATGDDSGPFKDSTAVMDNPEEEIASIGVHDLNTATKKELESIHGIGPATAQKILDMRSQVPFTDIEDAKERLSLAATIWAEIAPFLKVAAST